MPESPRPAYNLFFTRRFFLAGGLLSAFFVVSWFAGISIGMAQALTTSFILLTIGDAFLLFSNKKNVEANRVLPERLSNSDFNTIVLKITSHYPFSIQLRLIEELPEQFEIRENYFNLKMPPFSSMEQTYAVRPLNRGVYQFGFIQAFLKSPIGLVERRKAAGAEITTKVYPSFIQMRKYALQAEANRQVGTGSRQLRKIGHSLEFEQIKDYVAGDDIRSINWKATARKGNLMLNHYVDERSQQVFVLLDKGRLMKMPFNELSLLDYAINSTLVLCNVCLNKQDRFGLITFSHTAGTVLPAQKNPIQLSHVLESLYRQETEYLESDFEKLYLQVRRYVKHRSLLVMFTQFESMGGMKRQLPYLKQLAKHHLLLVVFFENTELTELASTMPADLEGIYTGTIAEKYVYEKKMIVKELQQHGILAVLSPPEKLTVHAVNKYLELKGRQAI